MIQKSVVFLLGVVLLFSFVSAQEYAIDVKLDKQIYTAGENAVYQVILLADNVPFKDTVEVTISDTQNRTTLQKTVSSNVEQTFTVDKSYIGGYWKIEAKYHNKTTKRFFSIGDREEVEFSIVDDTLIIKNSGNVPYTRTVQILIGEKIITQKQDIPVGQSREIHLIAPDGSYNIQVTDGKQTITRTDVRLTGTGNVIGALDEELAKSPQPLLGGIREGGDTDAFVLARHVSPAFIFVGAVGMLALLLFFERLARQKAHQRISSTVQRIKSNS